MAGRKQRRESPGSEPRRGMRRSIRYDAVEDPEAGDRPARDPDKPPEILLRMLKLAAAMERLEFQLRAYAAKGHREVLVIHGKGQNSAGGVSVLGPEVRRWCSDHTGLVAAWREAPAKWGGSGAIVVQLRNG